MRKRRHGVLTLGTTSLAVLLFLATACKKQPPTTPTSIYVVTITASGVGPTGIQVPVGARVQFVNNDSRSHYIHSDPHPDATDCPELNQVGVLIPGQRRETGNLVALGVCGYHDHDRPSDTSLHGKVTVR